MTMLLVGAVDQYGATQEGPLVVPLASTDHKKTHSTTPIPVRKTKTLLFAGIIGMTAAVASSALVFFSIMDFSESEPSFLLHDRGGADDNYCVVASGPWPGRKNVKNDDDGKNSGPYVTCFYNKNGAIFAPVSYCWSHSYYDSGDWKPCTPQGFGEMWDIGYDEENYTDSCGKPCTEFSSGLSKN